MYFNKQFLGKDILSSDSPLIEDFFLKDDSSYNFLWFSRNYPLVIVSTVFTALLIALVISYIPDSINDVSLLVLFNNELLYSKFSTYQVCFYSISLAKSLENSYAYYLSQFKFLILILEVEEFGVPNFDLWQSFSCYSIFSFLTLFSQ